MSSEGSIDTCHVCGLVQCVPKPGPQQVPVCLRCHTSLHDDQRGDNALATSFALAGLAFYLPAMSLPMLRVEQLGHREENSLVSGVFHMITHGYFFIGLIVLVFSVVLPLFKLLAIVALTRQQFIREDRKRAKLYHMLELLGKWGMLDVMLVAILIAFVKLGDLVEIHAGAGLFAFAFLVLLSLVAGLVFHPRAMWHPENLHAAHPHPSPSESS